jgi:hypothetical protein
VVEGIINSGTGPTTFSLTRTTKLVDSFNINYVIGATVTIQGDNNTGFTLAESAPGQYTSPQLPINANQKYRLYIKTKEGKEYQSEYIRVKKTPQIDSISWERGNGVQIFADTHDPLGNTRYYKWEYEETWEFHSPFTSSLHYISAGGGKLLVAYRFPSRSPDLSFFTCWQGGKSTQLLIASTAKLQKDTTHFQLVNIPAASWKLSVLYTIKVKQAAISAAGFEYLQRMKKNTEQTGSIFDAQPSELRGNIKCLTNPSEPVVGFLEVSDIWEKRIWINSGQVPQWGYTTGCRVTTVINHPDSIAAVGSPTPTVPVEEIGPVIKSFAGASNSTCVYCTELGTNVKPSFWP